MTGRLEPAGGFEKPKLPLPKKPRLRGVSHQWAFFVSLALGAVLVLTAPRGAATAAAGIYAVCVATLFGTSALYHRINWRTDGARRWMRRLDHSAIFLLIAGSYTPFAILVIDGTMAQVITAVVWGGALLGILLKLVWIDAPKWLAASPTCCWAGSVVVAAGDDVATWASPPPRLWPAAGCSTRWAP